MAGAGVTLQDIGAIRPGRLHDDAAVPRPSSATVERRQTGGTARLLAEFQLVICVLGPFAFGYFLSYAFRTVNALLSGAFSRELHIGPSELGLLTSVYFLATAVIQLPVGALLDRYGPRRVQGPFLLVAALGSAIFAVADGLASLVIGRALIGIGIATALMAGLKAAVLWFPPERIAFANGLVVMTGALGAVGATVPADLLIAEIGWRGLFWALAALSILSSALIFVVVPKSHDHPPAPPTGSTASLITIYGDRRFLRLAPLSALIIGTAWSLQGLWIAPWLADVEHMDRASVVGYLFVMGIALAASALALGYGADWARRHGAKRETLLAALALAFILAQLALIARAQIPIALCLIVIAAAGAATVLSYAILPEYFPKAMSGRANGALNVLHMFGAFLAQWLTGALIAGWPPVDGHPPMIAYQSTFGLAVALQMAALGWFVWPHSQPRQTVFACAPQFALREAVQSAPLPPSCYDLALAEWTTRVTDAKSSLLLWRSAGWGSIALAALLLVQVANAVAQPVVPNYVHVGVSPHQQMDRMCPDYTSMVSPETRSPFS
ncbi:MAG: MFS transporter [Alphaproteobacteria bacterium]|nr:MFS transporter [Alphaproteobacteria bacterium]